MNISELRIQIISLHLLKILIWAHWFLPSVSVFLGIWPITPAMKSLEDTCIHCIMNSIEDIPNIRQKLPRIYKELLLTRLSEHNLLTSKVLDCVKHELCVNSLQHLQLYQCDQVNDQFLKSFASPQRQLKTIVIEKCNVTG